VASIPIQGGKIQPLTDDIYVSSGNQWAPDGKRVYFGCKEGAYNQLCSVELSGGWKRVIAEPRNVSNASLSPDGRTLLFTTQDIHGTVQIRTADPDGRNERVVSDLTPTAFRDLAFGEAQEITWKSTDGLVIHGVLVKPLGYQPGRKYPLLVDLHGGPVGGIALMGSILMKTPMELHMWAAKGYAVLLADYRESEVFGWKAVLQQRENQDYLQRNMDDIMTGVDALIAQGIADPKKLLLVGHSYGGIMTNWIITHSHRFKVAVSYEGSAENYLSYGAAMRVGGNPAMEWFYKGKPWDVPQNYRKNAASEYVKGVETPTLFIACDYSGLSGVERLYEHEFMYTALRQQGVDTKMLIYRGEGHVISRPENLRDLMLHCIDWLDGHLNDGGEVAK
jgi:dipeptidyl aminopeptidase/acylaminoacyl peptidase